MKLSVPLGILYFVSFCSYSETVVEVFNITKNNSNLIVSVDVIISKIFVRITHTTNVITSSVSRSFAVTDFKNELLLKNFLSQELLFRHDTSSNVTMVRERCKKGSVFIIETFDDFIEIYVTINPNMYQFSGFYVVVLVATEISEVEEIFKLLWTIQIFRVIVMFEDDLGRVFVKTFFPFNPKSCQDTSPVLINTFQDGRFLKGLGNIFPFSKMRNLHKCPVRVATANDTEPYIFAKALPNNTYELSGPAINLITTLSQRLNFVINYTNIGYEGFIFENGTAEGPLKALLDGEADLSISNWWLKKDRLKFFDTTGSYGSDAIHFVIPPGRAFSAFEKLIFPFSLLVWIFATTTTVIGSFVIFCVFHSSEKIQNFVFGTGVRHPYMNMYIGFVGENQRVLPRRNFARFLLMVFLLYSLVMRSVYQGSYYQFLQSNLVHKRVETIEEMVHNDFTFYFHAGAVDIFSRSKSIRNRFVDWLLSLLCHHLILYLHPRIVPVGDERFHEMLDSISTNPEFKGASGLSYSVISFLNHLSDHSFNKIPRIYYSKTAFTLVPVVMYTQKDFFLTSEINIDLMFFHSSGLIQIWFSEYDRHPKESEEKSTPKVLTINHLSGSFQILFFGCTVSFFVFVLELMFPFGKQMIRK